MTTGTELKRDEIRDIKKGMRLPRTPYRSNIRHLVSVWLEDYGWVEDMRFRFVEDARVHAARWHRLYGVTLTQVSEVEV